MERQAVAVEWTKARANVLASRRPDPGSTLADPDEWFTAIGSDGGAATFAAWNCVSALTEDEAKNLLDWLTASKYQCAQLCYQAGKGFAVRFQ